MEGCGRVGFFSAFLSLVLYYFTAAASRSGLNSSDTMIGLWDVSTMAFTCVVVTVNLSLLTACNAITRWHHISTGESILARFLFIFLYSGIITPYDRQASPLKKFPRMTMKRGVGGDGKKWLEGRCILTDNGLSNPPSPSPSLPLKKKPNSYLSSAIESFFDAVLCPPSSVKESFFDTIIREDASALKLLISVSSNSSLADGLAIAFQDGTVFLEQSNRYTPIAKIVVALLRCIHNYCIGHFVDAYDSFEISVKSFKIGSQHGLWKLSIR
ncbi:hypothetical protein ACLOJK_028518 [Asimina triloba]